MEILHSSIKRVVEIFHMWDVSRVLFLLRPARESDHGWIARAYVGTSRLACPRGRLSRMPDGAWNTAHYAHARRLLASGTVTVACHESDDNALLGAIVSRGTVTDFLYVSRDHWRRGLAKSLIATLPDRKVSTFSLWPDTQMGSDTHWIWGKLEKLSYLPYYLEGLERP